ncbi:MAG: hypothetical protein MUF15_18915 [Acidobacteria bacterium]|jgi:hypothetical protein|nr:hypothetical protein [Acidobacteriota bacterium]
MNIKNTAVNDPVFQQSKLIMALSRICAKANIKNGQKMSSTKPIEDIILGNESMVDSGSSTCQTLLLTG